MSPALLTSAKKKEREREKTERQSGLKVQPGFGRSGGGRYGKSAGSALQQRGGKLDERERRKRGAGEWKGAGDESPLMCLCALCRSASLIHSWKYTEESDIEIKCKQEQRCMKHMQSHRNMRNKQLSY